MPAFPAFSQMQTPGTSPCRQNAGVYSMGYASQEQTPSAIMPFEMLPTPTQCIRNKRPVEVMKNRL